MKTYVGRLSLTYTLRHHIDPFEFPQPTYPPKQELEFLCLYSLRASLIALFVLSFVSTRNPRCWLRDENGGSRPTTRAAPATMQRASRGDKPGGTCPPSWPGVPCVRDRARGREESNAPHQKQTSPSKTGVGRPRAHRPEVRASCTTPYVGHT